MFSYQAFLEIRNCGSEDAGLYKVIVRNKVGEVSAGASLLVAEDQNNNKSEISPILTKVKNTTAPLAETKNKTDDYSSKHPDNPRRLSTGEVITPRQPYSPRRFYERRGGRTPTDVETIEKDIPKDGAVTLFDTPKKIESVRIISNKESLSDLQKTIPGNKFTSRNSNKDSCIEANQSFPENKEGSAMDPNQNSRSESCYGVGVSSKKRMNRQIALNERSIAKQNDYLQSSEDPNERTVSEQPKAIAIKRIPPEVIVTTPKSIIAIQSGQELILSCQVRGLPKPKIVWMKNAIDISNNASYTFHEMDGKLNAESIINAILKLASVDISHQGKYTISAFNICGDSCAEFNVEVVSQEPGK